MNISMTINFDMDGTIADFYGVDGWLDYLMASDSTPYKMARPLLNMSVLARRLNALKRKGYTVNIISWLSKNGSDAFNKEVTEAKKAWLKKHLASVDFDNLIIVPYGTPKHELATGLLFDDEKLNRDRWGEGAYTPDKIMEVLRGL